MGEGVGSNNQGVCVCVCVGGGGGIKTAMPLLDNLLNLQLLAVLEGPS